MLNKIRLKFKERVVEAELNASRTAEMFYGKLPVKLTLSRWGDEYYGDCGLEIGADRDARTEMEVGELAVWPDGNALCIFFGPTPASTGSEPRAVSPVNPIGKILGDVSFLKTLPNRISIEVSK